MTNFKVFKMKFILMILLSSIWLHANGCHMLQCNHNLQAQTYLHTESTDVHELFKVFNKTVVSTERSNPVDIVVIDPGHGGRDKGCSGKNSIEKTITLQVSIKLKALINERMPEIKVILTREEDKFVSLRNRAALANDNQADIFISVHCNYLRNTPGFRGSETFVLGANPADEAAEQIAMRENESITLEESYITDYDGFDPFSPESYILFSMIQNLYLNNSIVLAQLVDSELIKSTSVPSHGVKQGAFVVLKETKMPSILIETGYLSNLQDEKLLCSKTGQINIVQGIFNAIHQYKDSID